MRTTVPIRPARTIADDRGQRGMLADLEVHPEPHPMAARLVTKGPGLGRGQGERLVGEDVDAGTKRFRHVVGMGRVRGAHVDDVRTSTVEARGEAGTRRLAALLAGERGASPRVAADDAREARIGHPGERCGDPRACPPGAHDRPAQRGTPCVDGSVDHAAAARSSASKRARAVVASRSAGHAHSESGNASANVPSSEKISRSYQPV